MTPSLYIGTKIILSVPMTRQEYNDYRGWALPTDEDGADEGFLVEYTDGGKPNHPAHTGYISWSPKEQHKNAYLLIEPVEGLDIGSLSPDQLQLLGEKAQLERNIDNLTAQLESFESKSRSTVELTLLLKRRELMVGLYSTILLEIDLFKK